MGTTRATRMSSLRALKQAPTFSFVSLNPPILIILTRRTAFLGKTECPENLGAFTLSYLEPIRYRLPLVGGVSQFFVVNWIPLLLNFNWLYCVVSHRLFVPASLKSEDSTVSWVAYHRSWGDSSREFPSLVGGIWPICYLSILFNRTPRRVFLSVYCHYFSVFSSHAFVGFQILSK